MRIAELEQQNKELRDENKIKEDFRKEFQKLLRRAMGVDVTLDKNTMNPYLRVSEDGRSVWWTDQRQNLPDNPERFDEYPCVLGNRLPAEMRWGCYWEVVVGNKKSWELGVARDSVFRKGQLSLSPENRFWVLSLWDGKLTALTDPETSLDTKIPTSLGIHVDYEEKKVSFYNAVDGSHIYTFEDKIYRNIQPFFSPGNNDTDPLRITEPLGE
ncbi:E3 ubiquitin-protein ligase TRIM21-like [Lepisosteus oculatus]|uniref:E3 ubiquitin-protein ligase TRIM21-like n=1 Tax=Lepisosteus oculatus TaxID=7918 RepID=UPI00371755FE